jgi:hypothetical protein
MMNFKNHGHILFLSIVAVFLFGCSQQQRQETSADTKPQMSSQDAPVQEVAVTPAEEVKPAEQVKQSGERQAASQGNTEAAQKLVFAQNNMKMAQKGILNYSQAVAICRGVIKDYPNTDYEQQARNLLREVPEDLRTQYNLSDEELGL